jgi:hypothetical protein
MSRTLVFATALALVACSKPKQEDGADKTVVSLGEDGIALFESFATQMCACAPHDAACGQSVNERFVAARTAAEQHATSLPRVTQAQADATAARLKPVMKRYIDCAKATSNLPQ